MAYLRCVVLVLSTCALIACGSATKTGDDDDDDAQADAMAPPTCGDGTIDAGEDCDDGNDGDSDGCSSACTVEPGFVCTGEPSVCTFECDDNDGDIYGDGAGCLGTDCDDDDIDVNPGATEVCNGVDDNCDLQVDEASDVMCYDGPLDTRGVGVCISGVQACIDGALGPCIGQVLPGAEACNGLDDDCDDSVDEASVTLTCGIGECAASTPSCVGGVLTQCTPGAPGTEVGNCTDGLDNDCNGAIDDCTCVHVAPFGDDGSGDGTAGAPLRTINAGIALANTVGQPKCVYVAAQASCAFTFYNEDVVMLNGISVFGGYDPNTTPWTQRPHRGGTCRTEIRGQSAGGPAVLFDVAVTSPTVLDNFLASIVTQAAGSTSSVVRIEGSTGAIVSSSSVFGNATGSRTYGIEILEDSGGTAATPTIRFTSAEGGAGTLAAAIYSYRSTPTIQTSCSPGQINAAGQCFQGCISGIHIRGNRFFGGGATYPIVAYGVLLEESPGAFVDQSVICAAGETESVAVKIIGDATGTVVSRSDMTVWRGLDDNGIAAEDCGGAAPWIGDNSRIGAEGNPAGTAIVAAIRATGDCHPLIEANALIVGGIEGGTNETRGVLCNRSSATGVSSQCNVINNVEIKGCNNNFPQSSIGVRCEDGACNVISGNQLIHGHSGVNVIGIQLVGATNAFIDNNQIIGGCGVTSSTGILAEDGAARIQNNAIHAGTCNTGIAVGTEFYGIDIRLADSLNELDIHSNLIQGEGISGATCTSRGVAIGVLGGAAPPVTPLGILRNNIIESGVCTTNYAIIETDAAADPRFVENNALRDPTRATALYFDENTTSLTAAIDVNALTDTAASGNIDADPQYTQTSNGFINIPSGSSCQNTGTSIGAPATDFEGDTRPQEGAHDIGPDEYVP